MFRLPPLALVCAALPLLVTCSLVAQPAPGTRADWSQFQGPQRRNLSPDKGLLTSWPKTGPRLLWKGTGVGIGYSSVAVVGDKVFTMGNQGGTAFLHALSRTTSKKLWQTPVGEAGRGGGYPGTRCTPTVEGDLIYALGSRGDLVCADTARGKVRWRRNFYKDFRGFVGGWEYSESPLVDGDRVVCVPGGRTATIVALDRKTGKEFWRSPLGDRAEYSSLVVATCGGVKQYVTVTGSGTVSVRASDGKVLWRYETLGNNTASVPTPLVQGNQVFTCAGYGKGGALLTLSSDGDGVTSKREYHKSAFCTKHGSVLIVGDLVFGDTEDFGQVYCADWKTGQVHWKRGRTGQGRQSASMTYADGHLYVHYQNGWVALVPATRSGYAEKGSFKIRNSDDNSWAYPVVIGGRLYLREKDTVWCYDVQRK